jgi:hypothetical protein
MTRAPVRKLLEPRSSRSRLAFALLLAAGARSSIARADVTTEVRLSNDGRAEQLFHAGQKKFDAGDYDGACADFAESLKLGPKLGALLNLALCHETTGKFVTAWNEFSHGAAWAAQNNQRDRLEFAVQHVRSLEPRLPRVVLQMPANRAIGSIDLDGEPVPEHRWYMPLFLDPGEHLLAVAAPGKKRTTVAFRVILSPSEQVVMVPPLTNDAGPTPAQATQPRDDATRRLLGLVGLGMGAAGLAVGTTFGVLAITGDAKEDVTGHATVSTIAFVAGAGFAAGGGWLLWTSRTSAASAFLTPGPRAVALTATF